MRDSIGIVHSPTEYMYLQETSLLLLLVVVVVVEVEVVVILRREKKKVDCRTSDE